MKRKTGILLGIILSLMMLFSVAVFADSKPAIWDEYNLLSDEQELELSKEIQKICDTYEFEPIILISEDVYEEEKKYAAEFMQINDIGYGAEKDGMCIFHQPDSRIIAIVFRGQYQDEFSIDIQDIMLDHCTVELKEGNTVKAYQSLLHDLTNGLKRAVKGKTIRPMDIDGGGIIGYALKWLLLSFVIMAVPVLILVLVQMMKMKTKTPQKNADFYAPEESFDLQMCRDIYLRTDVKKTKIEKNNNGSGGKGSFKSGGESFSGSSRKY